MRKTVLRPLVTAALIVATVALAVFYALSVPRVVPASADPGVFSADRAMTHVREIARTPHPVGSADHARVRGYLVAVLGRLGIPAEVQETTGIGTRYQVAGRVRNVVARLPGAEPGGHAVLLMAHYDAVPASFGAGDDASGTSTILETLRALKAGPPLRHDVIALFADAEEAGLLGAAAFVREHPWAKDVGVTMNVEARGTRGPSLMFETGAGNLDVARELRRAPGSRATSLSTAVYRRLPNDTDLSEALLLERPALNFAFIGGVDRYHTSQDDVGHLDARSIQHHGEQVLAMTRAFGNGPLPRPATGDAVFFDLPLVGLVVYPESWALPLAVVAGLVVLVGILLARRHEAKLLRGILVGFTGTLASALLAAVLAIAVTMGLERIHAAVGSGRVDISGLYVVATALLAFAAAAASYTLARRWAEPRGLQAGALVAWAALSLVVAAVLPGGSFLFTWPLLLVAVAFLLVQVRSGVAFGIVAHAVAGVIAILIVTPIAYLMGSVALGLSQGGPIIAVLTALTAWLLAFGLSLLGDRSWKPALTSVVAAVAIALIGVATVRTNDEHPVGSSFAYIVNADSGSAWLAGSAQSGGARRWVESELGAMTSGEAPVATPAWLRALGRMRGVRAPVIPATPAQVSVVSDSAAAGRRILTLRVVPPEGAVAVSMVADSVAREWIDGMAVDRSRYRGARRGWAMEYVAPDPSGFTVSLDVPTGPFDLQLVTRRPGLPQIAGLAAPKRPPGILPLQRGDATFVYQRVRL